MAALNRIMREDDDAQDSFIRLIQNFQMVGSDGGSKISFNEFRELAAVYCAMRGRDRAGVASRFRTLDGAMSDAFARNLFGPMGGSEPTARIDAAWNDFKSLGGNAAN